MNEKTKHSDFEMAMDILRHANICPMIAIKEIDDDFCGLCHHLFACVGDGHFVKYTFSVSNGNDYLESIRVVNQSVEDLIVECAHAVFRDGFATMNVYAM